MGKHKGYAPALIKRIRRKNKVLQGNSCVAQAHRFFRKGYDTVEIARLMGKTEAEAERLLHAARNKLRGIEQAA
jgi:hypothetical protein